MGIWAGIKHAVNSTLGTSNFKPLDQLMDDKISSALAGYSPIRHIQKGQFQAYGSPYYVSVSLSGFQDLNKMVAFVSGGGGESADGVSNYFNTYVDALTISTLTIRGTGTTQNKNYLLRGTYFVIEFY